MAMFSSQKSVAYSLLGSASALALTILISCPNHLFAFGKMPNQLPPPEICDNGIDDDLDGLIDLNDTADCKCPLAIPQSLIPNPSFEDRVCCPNDRSQLFCAEGWIQASEPTTDYLHTCGWMGWQDLPVPVPFPDGEGCVGFRDGRIGGPSGTGGTTPANPNWKEYAGACLLSPLKAGTTYRFEVWVGFTTAFHSPTTDIVFYGSPDCANLPFGLGNDEHGCPLNGPGWMQLSAVYIGGTMEWKLVEYTVTPTVDIHAIALGPNCNEAVPLTSYYYFLDNLVLAEQREFEFRISDNGNPCGDDYTLKLPYIDTLQYQWYLDGVALVGENGASLAGVTVEGDYSVRILGPNSCRITPVFRHKKPRYSTMVDTVICRDGSVQFGNEMLTQAGKYTKVFQSWLGCDSTVQLTLSVAAEGVDTVFAKIFESETFHLGSRSFDKTGEYDVVLSSAIGCDSLVHLILDFYNIYIPNAFSPNGDGINDFFTIFSGEGIQEVLALEVYDRWGGRVYRSDGLQSNNANSGWDGRYRSRLANPGVYAWKATIVFDDGKERQLTGSFTLVR